jgi:YidC/Oxa1 family membrane protein insertase
MGVREALKESSSMAELLAKSPSERPVIFYAEDSFTHVQFEGYLEELLQRGSVPVHYVTSDSSDPLLETERPGLTVRHIDRQLARLFSKLAGSLLVMTMPDLGSFHVPKPNDCLVLYLFHSLNSTHTAYRAGAFDGYDVFACTGPHHVAELSALRRTRGLPPPELAETGYYKLDRIARDHTAWEERGDGQHEVLIAPSWGPGNVLEAHGEAVISALLEEGLRVTVRPHPQFFHSLYPGGREIVDRLVGRFGKMEDVEFELSIETETSFHRSDVMISDWSGAAFEYALGTLRPALFVETPQKIFNPEWANLGLPSFEAEMRERVGAVVPSSEVEGIGQMVTGRFAGRAGWAEELAALRDSVVYNAGRSARVGADLIVELAGRL